MFIQKINFDMYKTACISFREDSKAWFELDSYNFYTTNGFDWCESCDNSNGGIDVSWCFKLSNSNFEENLKDKYIELIRDNIRVIGENECIFDWTKEETQQYLNWIIEALSF